MAAGLSKQLKNELPSETGRSTCVAAKVSQSLGCKVKSDKRDISIK
jgi:hypothetical protein